MANAIARQLSQQYPHLSVHELQQLLIQAASSVQSDALNMDAQASSVPRTMTYNVFNDPQTPALDSNSMDRSHSAPSAVPMGRSSSTLSVTDVNTANLLSQRSISAMPNWQRAEEQHTGDYVFSKPVFPPERSPLQSIDELSAFTGDGMVEYSPADFINTFKPSGTPSAMSLTNNQQWSTSSDGSTSPSTSALMTPVTFSSSAMSRQGSFNPNFIESELQMLRVHSDFSTVAPILPEDGPSFSFSSDVEPKSMTTFVDGSHFPYFTAPGEILFSSVPVSASASALTPSESQPCLVEDMRRSASASSESNASNASASSSSTRQSRRDREINAQAALIKLAPKAIESNDVTKSASSNVQMTRIRSEDGSFKHVGELPRTAYHRPTHPKVKCPHCNQNPQGFRGTHELERHMARAHAPRRKGYICVDYMAKQKFLSNCKHCRNQKVYGAYYNAAAHLRRAHFHPRKRGRKGKNEGEKRGGMGGGDDPPMEVLKAHWIKEIEVDNTQSFKADLDPETDDSDISIPIASRSECEVDEINFNAFDPSAPYPPQPVNDASMSTDVNQYFDSGNLMLSSNTTAYDVAQYPYDPDSMIVDSSAFEFTAYMTSS